MFLNFNIEHITEEVKSAAAKAAGWTKEAEAILNGTLAKDIAAVIPDGEADREALIGILETAYKGCQALQSIDATGVQARLQRAGSDLTKALHAHQHSISFYITSFEIVFNDLFGAKAA